jgi:disulfide bond formation protein DsbB
MRADRLAALAGAFALAMVLGAVFFQYVVGVSPCEVCYWQRYPQIFAALVGLIGAALSACGGIDRKWMPFVAVLALSAIAMSGFIGVYHSGVEWKLWAGPSACTGDRYVLTGTIDLNAPTVVRCDVVAWRFLGVLSLANLNAIFSLGVAAFGAVFLRYQTLAVEWLSAIKLRSR